MAAVEGGGSSARQHSKHEELGFAAFQRLGVERAQYAWLFKINFFEITKNTIILEKYHNFQKKKQKNICNLASI